MVIDRLAGLPDDTSVTPNPARMYDYILGGVHNTEADRIAAEQARAALPDMHLIFRANRAFLRRAVLYLATQGIDQFLDVGSGIPTVGNVHEIAHNVNEDARVVYVDVDPVAVQFSAAILRDNAQATVIQADARDPASILGHPETRRLLDLDRPVALLLVSMLMFVPDDTEATGLVRAFRDALAPGSYLMPAVGRQARDALLGKRDRVSRDHALDPTALAVCRRRTGYAKSPPIRLKGRRRGLMHSRTDAT